MNDSLVQGVDFVCIPVADIDRAVAFYGGTLGLPERARWGQMPGVEFQAGNLTLALMEPSAFGAGEARPNQLPIALHVEDVHAARERLEAEGVQFVSDTFDSGVCWQAICRDPDGNTLTLHNRYAPK